jgi:hypothetical protein
VPFHFVDVGRDKDALKRMLEHSKGGRNIPVIVENGKVTVGFEGGY